MRPGFRPVEWSIDNALQILKGWDEPSLARLPDIDNGPKGILRPVWFRALVDLDLGEVAMIDGTRFRLRNEASGAVIANMATRFADSAPDRESFEDLCLMREPA